MKKQKKTFQQYMTIFTACWFLLNIFYSQRVTASEEIQIRHDPLNCAVSNVPLNVMFKVKSTATIKEVRIYFKARNVRDFYYVKAKSQRDDQYEAIIPGPMSVVKHLEYRILVVDDKEDTVTSPIFPVSVKPQSECPQKQSSAPAPLVIVFAEDELQPEIGFSGYSIIWQISKEQRGKAYLSEAKEVSAQPGSVQKKIGSKFKNFRVGKKTMIGVGAGLGTAALLGIIAGGGDSEGKSIWDSVDDIAQNVSAQLVKTPAIQTSCGTFVTNQLYVTNNRTEEIMIGTIDYETILTRDKPARSCESGRTGAFAPNLATVIPPGQVLLIREWSNEVNSCSGCPYAVAECKWESRYIVNTSAGSAVTLAEFTSQGNLCGTPTTKSLGQSRQIKGDIEP